MTKRADFGILCANKKGNGTEPKKTEKKRVKRMKRPYLVGIAGGSASGKTTFSGKLASELSDLRVLELHMDTYFKPKEERPVVDAPFTHKPYLDDNHPNSFRLAELKKDLRDAAESGGYDAILVEGLLTLWDEELSDMFDLRLFLECRADERIVRRLKRNMTVRGLSFDEIADVYLDMVRYRHDAYVEPSKWRADLILNGSLPSEKALRLVADAVRNRI